MNVRFESRRPQRSFYANALSQHRMSASLRVRCTRAFSKINVQVDPLSSTEYDSVSSIDDVEFEENVVPFVFRGDLYPRVQAPQGAPPIIILPGFGNCTEDYTAPFGKKENALTTVLEARGYKVYVLPLERKSWFQVARALFTKNFWSSSLTTDPGYTWYLRLVDQTIEKALSETGATQVDLIGHSAGGWLARAYLGDPSYIPNLSGKNSRSSTSSQGQSFASRLTIGLPSMPPLLLPLPTDLQGTLRDKSDVPQGDSSSSLDLPSQSLPPHNPAVRTIVTLGSPQRAIPAEKGKDRTGGALTWVHTTFPGAFFAAAGVRYISVGGRTVRGERRPDESTKGPRSPPQYAYDSYEQVCGEGQGVIGDAVVPMHYAFLGGAEHILLDGVWHSMSRIGTFDDESGTVWYGSEQVVDAWLSALSNSPAGPAGQTDSLRREITTERIVALRGNAS